MGLDGPLPRRGHGSARHPAQHEPLERPHVRGHVLRRLAPRRRLRGTAHAQRAAGRDHADQGHLGHASGAVGRRRVGELRDRALQARRRVQQEPAARQLRPRGVAERPAFPRPHRRQPVPLRLRRLERHPQRRRALRRVAVRRQGGGLHERPGRPRVRARAARRPRPAVPGTGREPVRGGARVPHARAATRPSRDRPPLLQRIGPGGHLGAGEHPGGPVRRHAAQGDLRHQRPAHHRAVRGRGDPRGRPGRPLPRHPRRRRGAGRGPRAARRGDAAVPRLGHGGPRQREAAAAADRQGLGRRRLAEGAGVRRRVLGRARRRSGHAPLSRQRRGGGPLRLQHHRGQGRRAAPGRLGGSGVRSGPPSFYYVRVLENPTCRWSTWDAIRAGVMPRPDLEETLQERAWSSPIWIEAR